MAINRPKLHHYWRFVREVKVRYLVVAMLLSFMLSAFLLRRNNLHMVKLRDAVLTADANSGDVETALGNLRAYVTTHMNTNLRPKSKIGTSEPPIQLVNTYNKAVQAAEAKAAASGGNQALYSEAEAACEQRKVPLTVLAQCIQDYIAARTNGKGPQKADTIPKELYSFDFVTPKWSPDLAGWSVLVSGLLLLALSVRLVSEWALRQLMHDHL